MIVLLLILLSPKSTSGGDEIEREDCYVHAISNPPVYTETGYTLDELLRRIITCEGGWDPKVCNKTYGCLGGMGLCQFISGTWNSTIDRMKKESVDFPERCHEHVKLPVSEEKTEMIFDYECNFIACQYLLEKDGDRHWRPYSGHCYLNPDLKI